MALVIVLAIVGAVFVALKQERLRFIGFTIFTATNLAWVTYGCIQGDVYIVAQFVCFLITAIVGLRSNRGFLRGRYVVNNLRHWILGWANIADGLLLILTFGCIRPQLGIRCLMWVFKRELKDHED